MLKWIFLNGMREILADLKSAYPSLWTLGIAAEKNSALRQGGFAAKERGCKGNCGSSMKHLETEDFSKN